jgi:hypothetical protein
MRDVSRAECLSRVRHRTDRGLHGGIRRDRTGTKAHENGRTYLGSVITRDYAAPKRSLVCTPVHTGQQLDPGGGITSAFPERLSRVLARPKGIRANCIPDVSHLMYHVLHPRKSLARLPARESEITLIHV